MSEHVQDGKGVTGASAQDAEALSDIFAVIDIGTVTCRFLLARVAEGTCETLARGYKICNLGVGVDAAGRLDTAAMERTVETVAEFLAQRDAYAAHEGACGKDIPTICVATSAARDAQNGDEFRARMEAIGAEVAIVPGQREAALSFAGAGMDFAGKPVIVVDVGGGSTEIIAGVGGGRPALTHSFNVGCRRLTERFFCADPPTDEEIADACAWAREEMAPYAREVQAAGFAGATIVAVAGTATTVVSVDLGMTEYDSSRVQGTFVSRDTLLRVCSTFAQMPTEERRGVVGLDPQRADVIVAGLLILQTVLELFDADGYVASETDLLQGAALALSRGETF